MASWTACKILLVSLSCFIVLANAHSMAVKEQRKWVVRRFIHGCPFAFPCPLPPCDNPVFGPHDCCGSCPDPDPEVTTTEPEVTKSPQRKLVLRRFIHGCPFAFPCPPPPCDNPVFGPRDCCGSCPDPAPEVTKSAPEVTKTSIESKSNINRKDLQTVNADLVIEEDQYLDSLGGVRNDVIDLLSGRLPTTTPPPTTSFCPNPCLMNGHHYCHRFPCHIRCIDAITPPGACCEVCPNGPNCAYNGHTVPEGKNTTLPDGTVVYCSDGDIWGGNVHVYSKPVVG